MTLQRAIVVVFLSLSAVLSIISCEEDSLVELDRIPDIALYDTTMTNCSKTFRVRIEVGSKTEKLYFQLAILRQGQEEPLKNGVRVEVPPPNTPCNLILVLDVVQADNIQPGEYQMVVLVFKDADKTTNDSDPFSLSKRFLVEHVLYVYVPSFPLCNDSCTCTPRTTPRAYVQLQTVQSVPSITSAGGDYLVRYGDICCSQRTGDPDFSMVFGGFGKLDTTAYWDAIWCQFGYGVERTVVGPGGDRTAYIEIQGMESNDWFYRFLPAPPPEGEEHSFDVYLVYTTGDLSFFRDGQILELNGETEFHEDDWIGRKGDIATWGGEMIMQEAKLAGTQEFPSRISRIRIGANGGTATEIDTSIHTYLANQDTTRWFLDTIGPSTIEFWER